MTETLHNLMNGPLAGKTMLVLRALFFLLFIMAAAAARRGGHANSSGKNRFAATSLAVAIALAAIFAYQVSWQIFGSRSPDLLRFIRRHNNRASVDVRRGSILDRNGSILAIDDPSSATGRRYPLGAAAAHVVGYFDVKYGMTGVEKAADETLTGSGATPIEEIARLGRGIVESRPLEGRDVSLTLDARLQRKCHSLLSGKRGAVVAMIPDTGEILALASAPSFDPLNPARYTGDNDGAPLLNRAIQGRYPAGSTFKVAMASIAASSGLAPRLDCPGDGFRAAAGAQPIRDVEYYSYRRNGKVWPGFGKIGLKGALVHSSNVYFAQLALRIPAYSFNSFVERSGIDSPVPLFRDGTPGGGSIVAQGGGIPCVEESDKKMRAQLAIGQGKMAVSPLRVAMWTSIVAAGGVAVAPHLDTGEPPEARRVMSATAAQSVADMMRAAVLEGTAVRADVPGAGVCGKTGTAQTGSGEDHSWFTCFTSSTSPRIVVTVIVEHGGFGARAALPIARGVIEEAIRTGIVTTAGGAK